MDDPEVPADIVDAARAYFLKYGYSRVSTAEIADQAGRSKKTLYKHFPTKEALLGAVLARINAGTEREILALLDDAALAEEDRVRRVLERVGVHLAAVGSVLYDDLESKEPALFTQARQQQRAVLAALLRRLLQQAVDKGVFRPGSDLDGAVTTYLAAVEAMAKPAALAAHADEPTVLFRTLVGWLMAGLK